MTDDLVQRMMESYAQSAVEAARSGFGVELDYSPASVERLEEILAQIQFSARRGWLRRLLRLGLSDEQLDALCKMFGGYLGEVIRRQHGGIWAIVESPAGDNVIALQNGDNRIFPPAKVYKRLTQGEGDDVRLYFQVVTSTDLFGASEPR
jgi:hypothetical protein